MIEDGFSQLKKGENFFQHVIAPLVGLPDTWTYHGLLCFPRIESRTVIDELKLENIEKVSFFLQIINFVC